MILKNIKTFSAICVKRQIKASTIEHSYINNHNHLHLHSTFKMIQQSNRYYLH